MDRRLLFSNLLSYFPDESGWISGNDCSRRDVPSNDASGSDHSSLPDTNALKDQASRTNENVVIQDYPV
jgi:hypothetical protein